MDWGHILERGHKMPTITVLIADDARYMRETLAEIITTELEDWKIIGEADNGIKAVKQHKRLRPDLIIMDVLMPECSGIDAVRRIMEEFPSALIIMSKSLGQEQLASEALQAGAKGCIKKPFNPEKVIEVLSEALE